VTFRNDKSVYYLSVVVFRLGFFFVGRQQLSQAFTLCL